MKKSLNLLVFILILEFNPTANADFYNKNQTSDFTKIKRSKNEVCQIPSQIPGFRPIDQKEWKPSKKQSQLCGLDFYSDPKIAICPKASSTNPGIEIYEVPAGVTKSRFEANQCQKNSSQRTGKKLAKLKSSLTCSYTPSILAYSVLSKALDAGNVPPSVLRTMDLNSHKKIVQVGLSSNIGSFWRKFKQNEMSPSSHPELFTADRGQIYGALAINPRNEERYSSWLKPAGSRWDYSNRVNLFKGTDAFRRVSSGKGMGAFFGRDADRDFNARSAQAFQEMKDISDMVLLDYVLNQQDRFGNQHYELKAQYLEKNDNNKYELKDIDADETAKISELKKNHTVVLVRKLLMKDNDCGVVKDNLAKKGMLLESLRHMSSVTYSRFLRFNRILNHPKMGPETAAYFKRELHFTGQDWNSVSSNIKLATKILTNNCKAGKLRLDVDIAAHMNEENLVSNCSGQ